MSWLTKSRGRLRTSAYVVPVAVAVLLGALAACGGGSTSSAAGGSGGSTSTGSASSGATAQGGNLTVVVSGAAWPSLDPANPTIIPSDALLIPAFEPLWYVNGQGEVSPYLATSYKVSPDGLTYTIELKQGVKFQDGTDFNADAVKYNLDRYASKTVNSECTGYLAVMKSATVTGPYEVTVQLSAADASFVPVLASQQCSLMVSPAAVKSEGAGFSSHPVGTGAYKYASGTTGVVAKFSAWDGYWGGKPKLDTITIQNVASTTDAYNAVTSGTAQAWVNLNDASAVTQVLQAKTNSNLTVLSGPALSINYMAFNFTKPPFNNPIARQAVNYATDPAAIVKSLYSNQYTTINGVFPPAMMDGKISLPLDTPGAPTTNLDKAKELVKQLGGLSFTLNINNSPGWVAEAEALQSQLGEAGIKVTLNPMEPPEWIKSLHQLEYQGLLIVSPALVDPDMAAYRWFYSKSPLTQGGLNDPAVDKLILQGRASTSEDERIGIYKQLNDTFATEALPWDDMFAQTNFIITSNKVQGFFLNPADYQPWASIGYSA